MADQSKSSVITIGNVEIHPGEKITLALPSPEIYTCAPLHIPIHVLHGKKKGPTLVICAAMHGDEINGTAIIQKLLNLNIIKSLRGTIIAIPVMNVYGLLTKNRNLPDKHDLEESFPGSAEGSFTSRLAKLISVEIFQKVTHCILLRSGEPGTQKCPQVHTDLNSDSAKKMAEAFQIPIVLNTDVKTGIFSFMHQENPIPVLAYDTGESLRLDADGIRMGVKGIIKVMRHLEMLPPAHSKRGGLVYMLDPPSWILSHNSGLCKIYYSLGSKVKKGDVIARVRDPFSSKKVEDISSPFDGIIIAETTIPIVNEGKAIVQIGPIKETLQEPQPTENVNNTPLTQQ